jgi:hypothetical protein
MRALRFHNFGSPSSVLRFEEIPTPTASDGELLQLRAAAINPSDVWNAEGRFSQTTLPRTSDVIFPGLSLVTVDILLKEVWGTGPGLGLTRDGAMLNISVFPQNS